MPSRYAYLFRSPDLLDFVWCPSIEQTLLFRLSFRWFHLFTKKYSYNFKAPEMLIMSTLLVSLKPVNNPRRSPATIALFIFTPRLSFHTRRKVHRFLSWNRSTAFVTAKFSLADFEQQCMIYYSVRRSRQHDMCICNITKNYQMKIDILRHILFPLTVWSEIDHKKSF